MSTSDDAVVVRNTQTNLHYARHRDNVNLKEEVIVRPLLPGETTHGYQPKAVLESDQGSPNELAVKDQNKSKTDSRKDH